MNLQHESNFFTSNIAVNQLFIHKKTLERLRRGLHFLESVVEEGEVAVGVEVDGNGVVFVDLLGEEVFGELVEHQTVDSPLDGSGAKFGVVTLLGEVVERRRGDMERDAVGGEHFLYALDLQSYDFLDFFFVKRRKHYGFVYTVEEFGTDGLL